MSDVLRDIVTRNRAGEAIAIPSVCSSHAEVLRASLQLAKAKARPVVIEATSNQVNQFGGYTGMTAPEFVSFVEELVAEIGIDPALVVLGGDHLGPQAWKAETADAAMAKARDLVASYVRAGIRKIHLDCSEGCAGEPAQLGDALAAARAVELALAAREAAGDASELVFVIGTEVPPPGGARLNDEGEVLATSPQSAAATLAAHRQAFDAQGVGELWPQVMGLVVQPGVEFAPDHVHHFPMDRDPGLRAVMDDAPALCLEAHSTDYQHPDVYPKLAALGFAFQKVGPALTHAWRQALYKLDHLLSIMAPEQAGLPAVMDEIMRAAPEHWAAHYAADNRILRHVSYADRIRYYWPHPKAVEAVERLFAALNERDLPDYAYAEAFGPEAVDASRGLSETRPLALARLDVQRALEPYFFGEAA